MACLCAKLWTPTRGKNEVYVAAVPLRATRGPAQLAISAAYSLDLWDLRHFIVILKSQLPSQEFLVFDFQPKDPENIYTALAVLSGRSVPGHVLVRNIAKLPRNKCWFIGLSKEEEDAMDVAIKFNNTWETNLRVGHHDCRHYTNGLVKLLTGEEHVLERLRGFNNQDPKIG